MNAVLANCELAVVVLLTMCFALLMEPLLFLGVLTLMKRGMRRRQRLPQDHVIAELELAIENVRKSNGLSKVS